MLVREQCLPQHHSPAPQPSTTARYLAGWTAHARESSAAPLAPADVCSQPEYVVGYATWDVEGQGRGVQPVRVHSMVTHTHQPHSRFTFVIRASAVSTSPRAPARISLEDGRFRVPAKRATYTMSSAHYPPRHSKQAKWHGHAQPCDIRCALNYA